MLDAALRIISQHGADGLTMRAIAADLKVEAPSLYKHVQNKDEILDGICELVYRQVVVEDHLPEWDKRLKAYAHAFRNALLRNHNVVPTLATRPISTEGSMLVVEAMLGQFTQFGFEPESARRLLNIVVANIIGQVLAEISTSPLADVNNRFNVLRKSLPSDEFPLSATTVMGDMPDRDAEFELSLDLLIEGCQVMFGHQLDDPTRGG